MNGQPVHSDQQISFHEPGGSRRHACRYSPHLNLVFTLPTRISQPGAVVQPGCYRRGDSTSLAFVADGQRLCHCLNLSGNNVFPVRIFLAIETHDLVASLHTCFGSRGIRHHVAYQSTFVIYDLLELDHEQPCQDAHCQNDIHEGSGEGNDQSLPARFCEEAARISGAVFAGLISRHLDVAPEQQKGDSILCLASLRPEESGTKAEAEDIHLDVKSSCRPKMAELVHDDHDANQNQQPPELRYQCQEICHCAPLLSGSGHTGWHQNRSFFNDFTCLVASQQVDR